LSFILTFQLGFSPAAFAITDHGSYTVHKEEPQFKSGSVFYSSTKKDEVLVKANVWGAVQFPGVHYVPLGTRFLEAVSFAGGPLDNADSEEIVLSSKGAKGIQLRELSLKAALASNDNNPVLQPDDILLVKETHTREKVSLAIQIGTLLLSAAGLAILISDHGRR
jgi:hypothetical protein